MGIISLRQDVIEFTVISWSILGCVWSNLSKAITHIKRYLVNHMAVADKAVQFPYIYDISSLIGTFMFSKPSLIQYTKTTLCQMLIRWSKN